MMILCKKNARGKPQAFGFISDYVGLVKAFVSRLGGVVKLDL